MIKIENLNVDLGQFHLHDINLNIEEGQFFVLLGPTGAGKTVLLDAISGLAPVKSGRILVGERDVTFLPPEKHGVGIVYQDYSLFPHLNVRDNIRYGLHFHRLSKSHTSEKFEELTSLLNISGLFERYPKNLSGGELQRVSLARALIVEPRVLLLDEPLSALDPVIREGIRHLLKKVHKSSGATFLMVTHDFSEALSLAHNAAIINKGHIIQTGTVADIFQKPCNSFTADFVGMKNILSAEFTGTSALVSDLEISLGRVIDEERGYIAIRPEDIVISRDKICSSMRNEFPASVEAVIDQGFFYEVDLRVRKVVFKSLITKSAFFDLDIFEGSDIFISFKATAIHNF